jgi:pantoate--beta-alanine ligase
MRTVTDANALRESVRAWKQEGVRIGLVPTMGNLHAGHFSLLELARQHAGCVVASIFVNPTQFGADEDYEQYPRTPDEDSAGLVAHGCDLLFAPSVETMYPFGTAKALSIHVPWRDDALEAQYRPGHFDGVATGVAKLLTLVAPDVAVFGQKDWQQLLVVRRLVRELALPVEVIAAPIVREPDGLAMSSRNRYLNVDERARAPQLHATLEWMRGLLSAGHAREVVERAAMHRLQRAGFVPDYVAIRRAEELTIPAAGEHSGLMALAAARLGNTRLIDNLRLG